APSRPGSRRRPSGGPSGGEGVPSVELQAAVPPPSSRDPRRAVPPSHRTASHVLLSAVRRRRVEPLHGTAPGVRDEL
ncbi:unnamed protein product, partial [Urochloa humidicola]